jgi:hypothetical protein
MEEDMVSFEILAEFRWGGMVKVNRWGSQAKIDFMTTDNKQKTKSIYVGENRFNFSFSFTENVKMKTFQN